MSLRVVNRRLIALLLMALGASCSESEHSRVHTGYVEVEWVYVAAPGAGWIVEMPVDQGSEIEVGELLFRLENTAEQARLAGSDSEVSEAQARAQNLATGARTPEIRVLEAALAEALAARDRAVAEQKRVMPLIARGIETASRGDEVEAGVRQSMAHVEAALENLEVATQAGRPAERAAADAVVASAEARRADAEWQLQQRDVRARVSGRVEELFLHAGEFASSAAPVLAILPRDKLKARFFVPQSELTGLSLGSRVQLAADSETHPIEAVVSYIAADAEYTPPMIYSEKSREKLVFLVEAKIPPGTTLRPGLPLSVSW